jgi:hypothetical protein
VASGRGHEDGVALADVEAAIRGTVEATLDRLPESALDWGTATIQCVDDRRRPGNRIQPGTTVFEAARKAGISIPTLCHHPSLPPEAIALESASR